MPGTPYTEVLDNLYTTTWYEMKGDAVESIFNGSPFWMWMKANGGLEPVPGGRFLTEPIRYASSDNLTYVKKGGSVTLSDKEFLTIARDDWKYLVDSIIRFGVDDQQNRGKYEIMSLVNAKLQNSRDSLTDEMEKRMAGTAGTDQFNGLLDIIKDDPTSGTVHGIPATDTWWRNNATDYQASGGTDFINDGDSFMNNMVNRCSRGMRMESPDLIVAGQGVWEKYFATTVEQRRVTNKTLGDAGFQNIEFRGIPMVWSPQVAPTNGAALSGVNTGRLYCINSRYLKFKYDPSMNFDMTNWKEIPTQINDRVAQIVLAGNLMTGRRRSHGVIFDIV